ncbi:nucleoside-diphosphate sugar epimerase/dehydratase [Granulicatella seriolae]|uniref:nucleoside-diphosphate sugar epimerase/dehydratase n=1 Tax=Granulicatella seriolae TaxID=2967226 RepID=UPI0023DFA806|nr:nucleoside-diphosphate sugar epimerase/dehydratase [Granulicatella seriolae]
MSRNLKRIILIVADISSIAIGGWVAIVFLSRYVEISRGNYLILLILASIMYVFIAYYLKIFSVINRFTDYKVYAKVGVALFISFFTTYIFSVFFISRYSNRFILLSFIFTVGLSIGLRLLWRIYHEYSIRGNKNLIKQKKRTLVVGAGQGGTLFIRMVEKNPQDICIIGLVDKDPFKTNTYIDGKKVIGTEEDIPTLVKKHEIDQVTIAIPSLRPQDYERIIDLCNQVNVKVTIMPSYEEVLQGKLSVSRLREIEIADLLGRVEVVLNQDSMVSNLKGKTVLVTGAGGSIGSELCRQLIKFQPKEIILLGHGENSIYLIHKELTLLYGNQIKIIPVIADIQDRERIFSIIKEYRPDRVYHAAAHKHVPLMEENPYEAVKNNILGTRNIAEASKEYGVEKFVMVSTDKAVNPPNVMGATKRVAEMIVTGLNEEGKTKFSAVRFGNVLGSRGSVVPLFKEQIAKGGPVTVTDFRMTRYFMTIPEASRLIIQAGALMQGGEVFVLDMGEPVKIVDLAKKVIMLSGFSEDEIAIVESGIRPGEKLYEELLTNDERKEDQIYEKIFVGKVRQIPRETVDSFIDSLSAYDKLTLKNKLIEFAKE